MTTLDDPPALQPDDASEATEPVARLKHPRATRWMHWINFPVILVMIWSGMRIYWSNDVYSVSFWSWTPFRFWPESVNDTLQLNSKLAKGIAYHLTFGWFMVLNGFAYVLFLAKSGEWRHIVPDRRGLRDTTAVVLHDLHLRKTAPPQGRYNAAQQVSYTAVLLMATVLVASGFAIYKPVQLAPLTYVLGGYETARLIHFSMTIGIMLFFLVHILQVVRAGWKNFASMVTGYAVEQPGEATPPPATAESMRDAPNGAQR